MKETCKFMIGPDGTIETVYDDKLLDLTKEMGGELAQVCRASSVEFERGTSHNGWTVRAAYDPTLAIRLHPVTGMIGPSRKGMLIYYRTREKALLAERKFFWDLLPPKQGVK